VKPENRMIRSAAAPGKELVLIDFGMANRQGPGKVRSRTLPRRWNHPLHGAGAGDRVC
jgi:hypothetical protein